MYINFYCASLVIKQVKVLHANKGQNTRINSINSFKNDEVKILVATDVASRGIDVSDVSHVINFDVPVVIEDYVHRIGRTGRAFQSGEAITFCAPSEEYYVRKDREAHQANYTCYSYS